MRNVGVSDELLAAMEVAVKTQGKTVGETFHQLAGRS
jgi:hypothetical protein